MLNADRACLLAAVTLTAVALSVVPAAQPRGGKIVCWKDQAGKVVGCGDSVPPEYQSSATKELDSRGVTRKTTDTAEEVARRKAQEQELAKQKAEEARRLSEQRRQDAALLNTFNDEKEIDAKRDRDLADVDLQITQLQGSLKNAIDRYNEAKSRNSKDDTARATADREKIEQSIATREKEKATIREKYAAQKKRYMELKGIGPSAAAPSGSPTAKK